MSNINWTKGIDQKTGKPLDYGPAKEIQTYSGLANQTSGQPKKACPGYAGGNNYWPLGLQPPHQARVYPGAVQLRGHLA
jgi:alcohol dehydrogenase (cytochrome c)